MVCLSVAVLTKGGRVLVAREFVEMTRMRIENYLTTFPKLVGSAEKQHNTVETSEVRYVYRPIEALLLVLITNKNSNIVEDLEMLRLFSNVVSEYCPGEIDEANVCKNAFELVFAFDEIVALGHRENVTLRDIQVNMEMESHEEKLAIMIRESKEREAREVMKEKATTIARESRLNGRPGGIAGGGGGGMGISGGDLTPTVVQGSPGGIGELSSSFASSFGMESSAPSSYAKPVKKGTGMQLGKPKAAQQVNLMQAMADEGELMGPEVGVAPAAQAARGGGGQAPPISLSMDEQLKVTMSRDGGIQGMEVKGELKLLIAEGAPAGTGKCAIPLRLGDNPGFQFKTHPNINKQMYSQQNVLGLSDASRAFPTNSAISVLKWRVQSTDESLVPLVINCWPTQTAGGGFEVNVEYELTQGWSLRDVSITIPVPGDQPAELRASAGSATYSRRDGALQWLIPLVDDDNGNATVEFVSAGASSEAAFFPIQVTFGSANTFCKLDVPTVVSSEDAEVQMPFSKSAGLTVESYSVE